MDAFQFFYGPRLVSGAGAATGLPGLLPPGPCLFVTDAQLRGLGLPDAALDALAGAGITPRIFDSVEADPSLDTLMAAVAFGADCTSVVGFGGGSPMDVAKLAAYLIGSGDPLDSLWGVGKANGKRLPLALVPTTAGTGSEATPVSIITVGGAEKKGISSAALVADWAILDAELTTGLPRQVTAATGIDAMVHAIEAYTSNRLKNPMSDLMAGEALRLLVANIDRACDHPGDLEARGAMLLGAHLAGVAFANAPVGGVHALAYPLGGHFHVPHGVSNALMLGHVLGHNLHAAMPLYAELGRILDPQLAEFGTQAQAQAFVQRMASICLKAGVPLRLSEVGVAAADLDLLAREAMKQERLLVNNPCPISEADARRLYEAAL
ncbi:iron-containing alcohol dehydrogenase [Sphingosinicella sp. BN140058]|uniref:iron-containing alcohol dehydrogenase n=1 Tax=Sphingosinicella sp. BN140058 TaxID=1892855 RepID=UPI00101277F6|nr:iron-containing alcohol dehydrogenase [Sphingosinicella sp. BN140058]QAY79483.1 iron-containing alcohol dehydrogenase [Sphingosinicella sp. BN140058]